MAIKPGKTQDKKARAVAGIVLVLVIALLVAAALARFLGLFQQSVPVTVVSDRAGLVMDRDAKVRARGVEIGRVADISRENGKSVLRLDIDPELLRSVPANATAHIGSNTVFGAKSVTFEIPKAPSKQALAPGATLGEATVTTEVNSMFQQLTDLLESIRPEQLNATLGALSAGLQGRGEVLGETIEDLNSSLGALQPNLDTLQRDLDKGADVANIYADASPDLMRLLDSGTDVGQTVVQREAQFEAVLANAISTAGSGNTLLTENGDNLIKTLKDLRATTSLLAEYSPSLNCMIIGLNQGVEKNGRAFGASNQPGLVFLAGFEQGATPYKYPDDLPKVNASTGPRCYGLPFPEPGSHAPFAVTDTGSNVVAGMPNSFSKSGGAAVGPAFEAEPGKPAPPAILQYMLGEAGQAQAGNGADSAAGNPVPGADAAPAPAPAPAPAEGGTP